MSMGMKLGGAVVVVTGASSGIGRATGLAFAERGARVVMAARRAAALEELARQCQAAGGQALAVPTDVTDEAAVAELAGRAVQRFGRIDIWVNNAGVYLLGLLEATPPEAFRRVLETNFGYVNRARAVLPRFRDQGRGVLINNASVYSHVGAPWLTAYVSSKFAVRLQRPGGQDAATHLSARAGGQGDPGQCPASQAGADCWGRRPPGHRGRKWFPRAGSRGSTAAMSTGCSSPPSQPPPPMATCTHLSPTAALRLAAADGAGPTRRLTSAGWPRSDCWPPAQSPSPGSPPAPAGADLEAHPVAGRPAYRVDRGGEWPICCGHSSSATAGVAVAVMWESRDARACCDS
jgi:hypothetical protein